MNKQLLPAVFFMVLILHLLAMQLQVTWLELLTKPLLVLILAIYFISHMSGNRQGLKKWVMLALLFSWTGDILLMFQGMNAVFFLLGLCSFLTAHVFYILYFIGMKKNERVKLRGWLIVAVVLYYGSLVSVLFPYLGQMKIPVVVYGFAISLMLLLALHALYITNRGAGLLLAGGAALFVTSDSLLAVNKFYQHFNIAGFTIMATYGLAQYFLVEGAIKYLGTIKNRLKGGLSLTR